MRALYAVRRLLAQPMTEDLCIGIVALAALVIVLIDLCWGLPE